MEDFSAQIQRKAQPLRAATARAREYLDATEHVIRGVNPAGWIAATVAMGEIYGVIDTLEGYKNISDCEEILGQLTDVYQQISAAEAACASLRGVLDTPEYIKTASFGMSPSFTMNMRRVQNEALMAIEQYVAAAQDNEAIFSAVGKCIDVEPGAQRSAEAQRSAGATKFIMDNKKINRFTIWVISRLISSAQPAIRRRLELIIERQKDETLGSVRLNTDHYAGVQGTISRYGLVPITPSQQPSELFRKIWPKYRYDAAATLTDNAAAAVRVASAHDGPQCGLIVLNMASTSPIEFNLRGLIDAAYVAAEHLETNPKSGLTEKILVRFNTARLLQTSTVGAAPIQRFWPKKVSGSALMWYIIETIDGATWRALGRGDALLPIAQDSIYGLIGGLTTRAEEYNAALAVDILAKCKDSQAERIFAEYSEGGTTSNSEETEAAVTAGILQRIETGIMAKPPKSIGALRDLIVDYNAINEVVFGVLSRALGPRRSASVEYMLTYALRTDNISRVFIRELENRWGQAVADGQITPRTFREYAEGDLLRQLTNVAKTIIGVTVKETGALGLWTEHEESLKEYFLERKEIEI